MKNDIYQSIADSLTPDQYIRLLDIVYGDVPEEIDAMSDDDLLKELNS